jgi:hypothetical protein
MIPVGRLAPADQWDQNLLDQLFANKLYPTGLQFRRYEGYPNAEGCCLLIPSRYWHQHTDQITEAIERYAWCLAFRCGDEEDLFDISKVEHPNLKWWLQTPRVGRDYGDARLFGVGFPPHFNDLPVEPPRKKYDVFISGQETHQRRLECFRALRWNMKPSWVVDATDGFTRGMPAGVYAAGMVEARVAPCPSGAVSPDSFRAWEALEAHTIPILDAVSPVDGDTDYWEQVLPGCPAPVLREYADLPGYAEDALKGWPANANRITAYYMRYKRGLARGLREDLQALGAL